MMRINKIFLFVMVWIICGMFLVCNANSAEPPRIIIIVPNATKDLDIHMEYRGETINSFSESFIFEKQYKFYPHYKKGEKDDPFVIVASDRIKEVKFTIESPEMFYNNFYTLDFEKNTLVEGKTFGRAAILVSLRVLLTLIIEGAIFFLFKYRKKQSWIAFIVINMITQTALNIYINSYMSIMGYYIISIFIAEIYILIAELIGFKLFLKEGRGIKRNIYVVLANIVSFILGGYILMMLPV